MSFDDIEAEAEALANELNKGDSAGGKVDLVGLAETVALVNKATEQSHREIARAMHEIAEAPQKMREAARQGIQASLEQLEQRQRELDKRSKAIDKKGWYWLGLTLAIFSLMGAVLVAASWFWFVPEITQYLAYRNTHQTIEKDSIYGAEVIENEAGIFIMFDEDVVIEKCNLHNCASVKK